MTKIFEFPRLLELQTRLKSTSSTSEKAKILAEYPDLKTILVWIYNPFKKFYVTADAVRKYMKGDYKIREISDSQRLQPEGLVINLLESLSSRTTTGHAALCEVASIIAVFPQYADLILDIIDKDLGAGVSDTIINKVWKGLIPTFDVALGEQYEDPKDIDWSQPYLASRKLDGCRCLTFLGDGPEGISFVSRQGLEFLTLGDLRETLRSTTKEGAHYCLPGLVLDGEICIVDDEGNEDFQAVMKVIRKKNHTIPLKNLRYYVFDILTREEFESRTSKLTLSERLTTRGWTAGWIPGVEILKQEVLTPEVFARLQAEVEANGWEGLILRRDTFYKGRRSKDILKVKEFKDTEVRVVDFELDDMQVITGGKVVTEKMLARLICDYKGYRLAVGGGFTQEERRYYMMNPMVAGTMITVKYFEETRDEKGELSLRFPVFKGVVPSKGGERAV